MNIKKKQVILLAAVILTLVPTAMIVFAQPSGINIEKPPGVNIEKWHGGLLLIGQGFAINPQNESDYHVLGVMAANRNQTVVKGNVRFQGQVYTLNITGYDNQSLTGDVFTLPPYGTDETGFTPTTVGNISLAISKYEGDVLSTGSLTMNGTKYNVILASPMRFFR